MTDHGHLDLANTPAGAPPEGQTSNFVDPPSQQTAMIAVSTAMMVLVLISVPIRLYTSFRINRTPGFEDCESFSFLQPNPYAWY